jgi:hypothetical protein
MASVMGAYIDYVRFKGDRYNEGDRIDLTKPVQIYRDASKNGAVFARRAGEKPIPLGFDNDTISERTQDGEPSCVELQAEGGRVYVVDRGATWPTTIRVEREEVDVIESGESGEAVVAADCFVEVGYETELRVTFPADDLSKIIDRADAVEEVFRAAERGNRSAIDCRDALTNLQNLVVSANLPEDPRFETFGDELNDLVGECHARVEQSPSEPPQQGTIDRTFSLLDKVRTFTRDRVSEQ